VKIIDEARVLIKQEADIVTARQKGRTLAARLGFLENDQTVVAIAISEIASNIVKYAGQGEMVVQIIEEEERQGLHVVATDQGPGIPDIELALQDGYSTGKSLGLGLPGAKRLMDDLEILSEVGTGTTVIMKKWKKS
jgi:serine/threonine-protein kinase RsbT